MLRVARCDVAAAMGLSGGFCRAPPLLPADFLAFVFKQVPWCHALSVVRCGPVSPHRTFPGRFPCALAADVPECLYGSVFYINVTVQSTLQLGDNKLTTLD